MGYGLTAIRAFGVFVCGPEYSREAAKPRREQKL